MITKTISMCQGKGSLSHNNREFTAKNIDPSRTVDNIVFVQQDLGEAYHQLFDEAVERYNAHQKRKDRMIDDYFPHLFNRELSKSVITGANKQKSFYEDLVQIGTKDDTGVGTPDAEVAVACLKEYMEGFQKRNPNLYVFNAVMHLDEATPHLHINYIPDYEKEFQVEYECDQLRGELVGLLGGKLSVMKHKDAIIAKVQRLCKLVKKVNDNAYKSGNTIYSLHEELDAAMKEYDDVCQRWKRAAEERTELRRDNAELSAEVDDLTEFVSLPKRLEPQKYAGVKQAQEYVHGQREQEVQQSATRKKEIVGTGITQDRTKE